MMEREFQPLSVAMAWPPICRNQAQARVVIATWATDCNTERPALDFRLRDPGRLRTDTEHLNRPLRYATRNKSSVVGHLF
jgi:hypothetical protein